MGIGINAGNGLLDAIRQHRGLPSLVDPVDTSLVVSYDESLVAYLAGRYRMRMVIDQGEIPFIYLGFPNIAFFRGHEQIATDNAHAHASVARKRACQRLPTPSSTSSRSAGDPV